MVIAINTIGLKKNRDNEDVYFLKKLFIFLAETQPNHSFIFIVNEPLVKDDILPLNCKVELVKNQVENNLQLIYFSIVTLKRLLESIKLDLLVHINDYCCVFIKIPQLLVCSNTAFPTSIIGKSFFRKSIQKVVRILVNSNVTKQAILTEYQTLDIQPDCYRIQIIKGAATDIFKPLDYIEKVLVKDGYADSREYFLSIADTYSFDDFITLLKAFSLFKRWQKSSMKLLVIGNILDHKNQLTKKIATYKYQDDIVCLNNLKEAQKGKLIGSAYALLSLSPQAGFAITILQALKCDVPVIASETADLKEYFEDVVLYVANKDFEALANQMKLLYRDENKRNQLLTKGSQLAVNFSYQQSADILWKAVISTKGKI